MRYYVSPRTYYAFHCVVVKDFNKLLVQTVLILPQKIMGGLRIVVIPPVDVLLIEAAQYQSTPYTAVKVLPECLRCTVEHSGYQKNRGSLYLQLQVILEDLAVLVRKLNVNAECVRREILRVGENLRRNKHCRDLIIVVVPDIRDFKLV